MPKISPLLAPRRIKSFRCPECDRYDVWMVARDDTPLINREAKWYYECKWCGEEWWNNSIVTSLQYIP